MPNTTIQISTETKKKLEKLKKYRRETYNDIIQRLVPETRHTTTQTTKREPEHRESETQTTKTQQTQEIEQED